MILIGVGSNLAFCGRVPAQIVQDALNSLSVLGEGACASSLYRSSAWPDPSDPPYINAALKLDHTPLGPAALLEALHASEDAFGRERAYLTDPDQRYAPRTLDLDLLAYHGEVFQTDRLAVPHPGIADRDFVLLPLAELAPDWHHPSSLKTAGEMLVALQQSGRTVTTHLLEKQPV